MSVSGLETIPETERELEPEHLIGQMSSRADKLLKDRGAPKVEMDGYQIQELEGTGSSPTALRECVKKETPLEGVGSTFYEYSFVHQEREDEEQVFRWQEGGSIIERSVRSFSKEGKRGDLCFKEVIEPIKGYVDNLGLMAGHTMSGYGREFATSGPINLDLIYAQNWHVA